MSNPWYEQNIDSDVANAIVRLRIVLPNRSVIERDFRADLVIDYDNLEKQMEEMPSIFSFWSLVLSERRMEVSKLERISKLRRATLVNELVGVDEKSIPKWKIDELIEIDDKLIEIESKYIVAKRTESKLFGIVDALRMKSELIRSLAGFKRQELRDAE